MHIYLFCFFSTQQVIGYLKSVYGSVADIDLYIGGVTENHMPGAAVGPTFGYIIASQFQNLKTSDRFFYSDRSQPFSFTKSKIIPLGTNNIINTLLTKYWYYQINWKKSRKWALLASSAITAMEPSRKFNRVLSVTQRGKHFDWHSMELSQLKLNFLSFIIFFQE